MDLSRDEMTARKSERLLNLLITLLVARTFVTKARIREAIEPYRDAGDEAFDKMFERDKEELRSLGVPIEVGHLDQAFEDEPGYRVERSAFELPDVDLSAAEAGVLGLAARVWQHAGLAAATSDALVKLRAAGIGVDREALAMAQPLLSAEEPAFEPLWEATRTHTPVTFDYRTSALGKTTTRHLQPWGVVSSQGRWYVAGHDTDRGEPRVFRVSRVRSEVRPDGPAGSYQVPPGTDLRAMTVSLAPRVDPRSAEVWVRQGRAHGLRRHARISEQQPDTSPEGWERLTASYGVTEAFVDEVLGFGPDVVVIEPADVRDAVLGRLREAATLHAEMVL